MDMDESNNIEEQTSQKKDTTSINYRTNKSK